MIQKLSAKLARNLISIGKLQNVSESVLCYGCELILTSVIGLLLLIILSLLIHRPLAWIFFVISFAPHRTSAGGYHADTHTRCYMVTSTMFLVGTSIAYGITWSRYSYLLISFFSALLVSLLAPVAATNKPLSPKRHKTNRIRSLLLAIFNMLLAILLLIVNTEYRAANMYYSGILFAAISLIIGKIKLLLKGEKNNEA